MATPYEDGPNDARLLILGESAGGTELRLNKPFVGPSGDILNEACHEAGILRREVKIINALQCPVRKDEKTGNIYSSHGQLLFAGKRGFTEAGEEHVRFVQQAVSRMPNLNMVIGLGGVALRLLSADKDRSAITKWRGSLGWSPTLDRKYITSVHPAWIMRGNNIYRHILKNDLKRAKEELSSRELNLPNPTLLVNPYQDCIEYLEMCNKLDEIATDIECYNRQVSCFCLTPSPKESMSIPLVGENTGTRWSVEEETEIWRRYAKVVSNPSIKKTNANIGFDLGYLFNTAGIIPRGPLGDPIVAFSTVSNS